ncbi:MAG: PspC domain-containing protein [Planctomycetota bacterium]
MKKCPFCYEEIQEAAIKCKHCGESLIGGTAAGTTVKRLFRSRTNRMLAGVCGGLAAHMGIDPTVMRLLVVLGTVSSGVLPGIVIYIVMALIVPAKGVTPCT